ncbi:hypothetical protein MAPG_08782 [Magnaporthiopsis poae ATCC 64411]|uniref:Heterokaryon incompatibility domain-containing protein n=1 Tax=Magnaporthiopsis poae (strain ATCC 64411 / 73-15) TaxID=644358 RepID=A0A0C4E885_MAGP6|nr:hypothetical protein MAPG_08782 [Magnaporthiopsis poae ATCC 64411]
MGSAPPAVAARTEREATAARTKGGCPKCRILREQLEGKCPDRDTQITTTPKHKERTDCPHMRLIGLAISELRRMETGEGFHPLLYYPDSTFCGTVSRAYLVSCYKVGIGLVDKVRGPIQLIPDGPIDIARVRRWISTCERRHHGRCAAAKIGEVLGRDAMFDSLFPGLQVLRLVNLSEGRLEEFGRDGPPPPRYATLSYVWGGAITFRLGKANKANLLTRVGFSLALGCLPKTIVDTMDLLRQLGEQYLWVDALCLVQDDPDDVQLGVAIMDRIFETAAFTVAAAGGSNADSGLDGFRSEGAAYFSRRKRRVEIVDGRAMAAFASLPALLEATVWSKRAWTFQEQILSRRMLYFVDQQVFFHCPARLSSEWLVDSVPSFPESTCGLTIGVHPSNGLSYSVFMSLLRQYTSRKLTFEDDAMRAMAGIIRRFSELPVFQGGFFQGMPRSSFDGFLLFSSRCSSSTRRRCGFPSYSWTGWAGPLEYDTLRRKRLGLKTWLCLHTWITWFSTPPPSSPGESTLVWDPSILDDSLFSLRGYVGYPLSREGPLRDQSGLSYPAEAKVMPTKLPPEIRTREDLQYPLLQFWTFAVFYRIRISLSSEGSEVPYLISQEGRRLGRLYVDGPKNFLSSHRSLEEVFEFILLSQCKVGGYFFMYIEWMASGIAERRGVGVIWNPKSIPQSHAPGPVWKEIILA